jgi:hypothetical protein
MRSLDQRPGRERRHRCEPNRHRGGELERAARAVRADEEIVDEIVDGVGGGGRGQRSPTNPARGLPITSQPVMLVVMGMEFPR